MFSFVNYICFEGYIGWNLFIVVVIGFDMGWWLWIFVGSWLKGFYWLNISWFLWLILLGKGNGIGLEFLFVNIIFVFFNFLKFKGFVNKSVGFRCFNVFICKVREVE